MCTSFVALSSCACTSSRRPARASSDSCVALRACTLWYKALRADWAPAWRQCRISKYNGCKRARGVLLDSGLTASAVDDFEGAARKVPGAHIRYAVCCSSTDRIQCSSSCPLAGRLCNRDTTACRNTAASQAASRPTVFSMMRGLEMLRQRSSRLLSPLRSA